MTDDQGRPDLLLSDPQVAISPDHSAVIVFGVEPRSPGPLQSGKKYSLGMQTRDAMLLLAHLENLQKRFDLPKIEGTRLTGTMPSKDRRN